MENFSWDDINAAMPRSGAGQTQGEEPQEPQEQPQEQAQPEERASASAPQTNFWADLNDALANHEEHRFGVNMDAITDEAIMRRTEERRERDAQKRLERLSRPIEGLSDEERYKALQERERRIAAYHQVQREQRGERMPEPEPQKGVWDEANEVLRMMQEDRRRTESALQTVRDLQAGVRPEGGAADGEPDTMLGYDPDNPQDVKPTGQMTREAEARDKAAMNDELERMRINDPEGYAEIEREVAAEEMKRRRDALPGIVKAPLYAVDLWDSAVGGLAGGAVSVAEGAGNIVGGLGRMFGNDSVGRAGNGVRNWAKGAREAIEEGVPTDLYDTSGGGVVNSLLETGKNIAHVSGEFAPAMIPLVGQAYAGALIGAGATNAAADTYEVARATGLSKGQSARLALLKGELDGLVNMLLMGKFKGVWGRTAKGASDGTFMLKEANKYVNELFRRNGLQKLLDAGKAAGRKLAKELPEVEKVGGLMGASGVANQMIDETATGQFSEPESVVKTGIAGFVEGGLFHLMNKAARKITSKVAKEIKFGGLARSLNGEFARKLLRDWQARAMIYGNNQPEAIQAIISARQAGMDVTPEMLRKVGIPRQVAPSVRDCNAIADVFASDYRAWNEWVKEAYPSKERERQVGLAREIRSGVEMDAAAAAKERAANEGGMLSADEAREQQRELNDASERNNAEQTARELKRTPITTNKEQLAREEAYPRKENSAQQEGQNETGNGADETPAQPEQGAREPQGGEAEKPVEGATPRAEAPREGVVEPPVSTSEKISPVATEKPAEPAKTAGEVLKTEASVTAKPQNRAEAPVEPAEAKGGAEATTATPEPAAPAETASGASGAQPSVAAPAKANDAQKMAYARIGGMQGVTITSAKMGKDGKVRMKYTRQTADGGDPTEYDCTIGKDGLTSTSVAGGKPTKTTASAPAAPTTQPQSNKPNKESSPNPAPKSNRLRRRDGTDPIAEREAAKRQAAEDKKDKADAFNVPAFEVGEDGQKKPIGPAVAKGAKTETPAAKTEQKAETPPSTPEEKDVPMTPRARRNRAAEVQKILAGRPKDLPLTPGAFMAHASDEAYASGRKKTAGLTLGKLRELHGDKTWHNDLGLSPEEAQRVRDAVDRAYEYAYLGDKRGGKYEAVATALRFLDAKPDDLTAIARARTEIVNALDKAERKDKLGRQLLEKYLGEVMDKVAALPPEQQAKIPGLDKLNLKTIDRRARKNETSITNSEGKDMEIAVGERGVEEEAVDEDGKTAADKSISAEIDAAARSSLFMDPDDRSDAPAAPPKGTRGHGGSLGGNRHLIIDGVNGNELAVTMKDAAGKVLVKGQKMTRAQWAALANGADAVDGDPAAPKKGDLIRQSKSDAADIPDSWTPEAKKPLERVAQTLRNVVTVGGKKVKVIFADRPTDVDGQTRKSIGGVFTGSAADYANRSRQGGVDDGPSLLKIGTGEGSQVYGWGLYGSTVRGVAEEYARAEDPKIMREGKRTSPSHDAGAFAIDMAFNYGTAKANAIDVAKEFLRNRELGRFFTAKEQEKALNDLENGLYEIDGSVPHLYEQTFFTDRAPGDESHLLKWYEPITSEQIEWVAKEIENNYDPTINTAPFVKSGLTGEDLYINLQNFGKREYGVSSQEAPKFASELLRDAGIDGVKYPVDSYGGKGVKDGDKAGWNYVSFRDDNIRVDHKWVDGNIRYMKNAEGVTVGEYDTAKGEIRLYPGAKVADVVHEFTHPLVDFARTEAKAGRPELLNKIKEIIDAERATWEEPVRKAYKGKGEGEILEEIFTHAMGQKGADLFGKSTKTLQGRRWYNRLWEAIKGVWRDFATKMGWNKADLRGIEKMSPEDAAQKILSEMAKGRSFGDVETGGEGVRNANIVTATPPPAVPGGKPIPTGPTIDMTQKETKGEVVQRKMQDFRAPLKRMEEQAGITDKSQSVYHALDLNYGKNRDQAQRLTKSVVEPMMKRLYDADLTWQKQFDASGGRKIGLDDYVYAVHALERNPFVSSGMDDAKARAILDVYDSLPLRQRTAIHKSAQDLFRLNKATLVRRVQSGRLSAEEANRMLARYQHYVPLRTDMEQWGDDLFNTGTGGWSKHEFHKALGRTTEADSPTVFSLMQANDAITGANKNEARLKLWDIVAAHPELGRIRRMDKLTKKWSYTDGREEWVADERYNERDRDDLVMVKRNGQLYAIQFNGEFGKRIAAAVTGKNLAKFPDEGVFSYVPRVTRLMAEMRTQLVPTFILRNIKADHLDVLLNSMGDFGPTGAAKFLGSVEKNFVSRDTHRAINQYFNTGRVDTTTEAGRLFDEFTRTGSLIGGGNRMGYADTATELSDFIHDLQRGKSNPARMAKSVGSAISILNEHVETGTRFSVYATLRKMGRTPEEAATYCRDLTTNFNRKGEWTPVTNSLFMFSNAAIQGIARAYKSGWPGAAKFGGRTLATVATIGALGSLWNHFVGSDDERKKSGEGDPAFATEYDKANRLVVGAGGYGANLRVRYPWAAVQYASGKLAEYVLGDCSFKDLAKGVGENVAVAMLQEPFGHGGTVAQTLSPSLLVPFTQVAEGKDFRGEDLYAKKFDENTPDSENGKRSTGEGYKSVARAMNRATGGDEFESGLVDVSPETVKLVVDTLGGGVWTDIARLGTVVEKSFKSAKNHRNEFELRDVPFLGDLVHHHRGPESRYYEAMDEYGQARKKYQQTKDMKARAELGRKKPYVRDSIPGKSYVDILKKHIDELTHQMHDEIKVGRKWVQRETPLSDEKKNELRRRRAKLMATVLRKLGKVKVDEGK